MGDRLSFLQADRLRAQTSKRKNTERTQARIRFDLLTIPHRKRKKKARITTVFAGEFLTHSCQSCEILLAPSVDYPKRAELALHRKRIRSIIASMSSGSLEQLRACSLPLHAPSASARSVQNSRHRVEASSELLIVHRFEVSHSISVDLWLY